MHYAGLAGLLFAAFGTLGLCRPGLAYDRLCVRDGDVWAVHARVAAQSWAQGGTYSGTNLSTKRGDAMSVNPVTLGGLGSREPVHCGP